MSEIYLHNRKVDTVFHLLGEHENDISYSVAWALAQCPSFLHGFLRKILRRKYNSTDIEIRLQHSEDNGGITDIEVELINEFYLIIEAKRGWNLPNQNQLGKYARRPSFVKSNAPLRRLVVLSECSKDYADHKLEVKRIGNIDIIATSWRDIVILAKKTKAVSTHAEKRLLNELLTYLGEVVAMPNIESNWVYVVSLSSNTREGWSISWIDIVKKKSKYFHRIGSGWPKDPPNYIGFRHHGKLQSIHHIEDYEVVVDMHQRIPEIPKGGLPVCFLYKLGRAFAPSKEVRTGNIYPNGRVWYMLDTLFTCKTISEARDVSKKRREKAG